MTNTDHRPTEEKPVELPAWLEALLPAHRVPQNLSTEVVDGARILRLTDPDGSTADYAKLADVDRANGDSGFDLTIDDEVFVHFSEKSKRHLSYPSGKNYVGIIFSHTDADRRRSLVLSYEAALENQISYAENPKDFAAAWRFIDSHPAFWTSLDAKESPWYWTTQGYCSKLRLHIYTDDEIVGYGLRLEAGGHVEVEDTDRPAYSEHYADWRLEATASSYEEAIIALAFRVSKAFDAQGNDLGDDDFPFDPPQWVEELRETLADSNL